MSILTVLQQARAAANLAAQNAGMKITATLDGEQAQAALASGEVACLVEVENTVYDTWTVSTHNIRYIIVSPSQDLMTAWNDLDGYEQVFRSALEAETAQFTMFQTSHGGAFPALLLQSTIQTLEDE